MSSYMGTYSFEDAELTLKRYDNAILTTNGQGMGSITISYAADRSSMQYSSDGRVVVSKLLRKDGTLELVCQQTSQLHKDLIKWFNVLDNADRASWATTTGLLTNASTGEKKVLSNVVFTKIPDTSYEADSGTVTWSFLIAEINTSVV